MERIHTLAIQQTCDIGFISKVEEASGQHISKCYQCGNCTASCAYTHVYDYPVNQIMRLVQLGQKKAVLQSRSIWLCATCQACTTRCPNNLDVARIMETLRIMSRQENMVAERDIELFYHEFLESIKAFGRVFETGLLPMFSLKAGKPFTDMDLAPRVLKKGKLAFLPQRIKGRKQVAAIFHRFEAHQLKRTEELRQAGLTQPVEGDSHPDECE
ncbi:4Fe-4S dicluster domain-containing protein [Desulfoferrobacter suflitae]|uniref:4Fe-4S dicluster domain-containing protein n=1 Tax=Desulfoferrobacter suflitae TaxID=2865782 RepID=UPI0021648BEA|nr:4Fe-4S dicluster domain-containing protein [Desulfoferrobacter suflitae]MCK8603612.1 4Fe-4S dicluster domain-containing protein [Desulfoferrobacter suflitae]